MNSALRSTLSVAGVVIIISAISAESAQARSIRESFGYTGRHTHATWAGPGVGLIAWTTSADFVSWTACGSSQAGITVDAAWDSSALHNGAELDMLFSVQRSDGKHFGLKLFKITKAAGWPGHPAFGGQFRATVYTPKGLYLKSGTVMSWIVNGGTPWWGPNSSNTVTFKQWTKNC